MAPPVISPDTNEAVIRRTRELDMVSMPGAMTPTEMADLVGGDFGDKGGVHAVVGQGYGHVGLAARVAGLEWSVPAGFQGNLRPGPLRHFRGRPRRLRLGYHFRGSGLVPLDRNHPGSGRPAAGNLSITLFAAIAVFSFLQK